MEGKWETVKEPLKVSSNVMGRLTLVDFNKKRDYLLWFIKEKKKAEIILIAKIKAKHLNKYINQILANAKEYLNESNTTPLCLLLNVFSNFKTTMKMKMKKSIKIGGRKKLNK